ncbi:hypothetical protein SALBM135S_07750 [Streptomyces alboniger]
MTLATATKRSARGAPRSGPADHGAWFLVLPALIPILVLSVGPLLYGIALAFTDSQAGRTEPTQWIGTLNFQDLLHDTLFWDSFRIGLVWAFGVTVPQFFLALGLALLLNQPLRMRWLARALAIIPWAMPEVVVGIMWRLVYHPDAGVLNETLSGLGLGAGKDWLTGTATALFAVIVVHDQVNTDRSASGTTLGMGGSDTLPGFFGGKYAMVPLGFSYRQQIAQQAPEGFEWQVLPAPAGSEGLAQGVSPQTLSVSEDSPHKKEAAEFIDFFLRPPNMVKLARGDWMLPTGEKALKDPALRTEKNDWATGTALAEHLRSAPAQSVRGYPEWKDKVATPAFQEYYSGAIDLAELRERLVKDGNLVLARYQR